MLLALAFCDKDYLIAEKLFRWMAELDGQNVQYSLLLMASGGMDSKRRKIVERAAQAAFRNVFARESRTVDESGWPESCNTLFLTTYHEVKRMNGGSFFWIEPDCTPIKAGWIGQFESEYNHSGKPFMGCVYGNPLRHLTGCAIYPTNIEKLNPKILKPGKRAWDVVNPGPTLLYAHHTEKFQHVWGNFTYNIPPSFPNQASLRLLHPGALLFHRCKDGTLIDRLRERRRFPKLCSFMAKFQNPSNHFQDFDDVTFAGGAS